MSKTYAIGDIHGRYDLLCKALAVIEGREDEGATVVFLGDYIDRGPQSREVVQCLIDGPNNDSFRWIALTGNHEKMALDDDCLWLMNGGKETIASYEGTVSPAHLEWMAALPNFHEDQHRVYVHAMLGEEYALSEQPERITSWGRYPKGADVGYRGRHVVHGHTPQARGPELLTNRTNLDTGAVFGGPLSVGVFDDARPGGPVEVISIQLKD